MDIISLFCSLFTCFVPLIAFIVILYFIFRRPAQSSINPTNLSNDKKVILDFLKTELSKGNTDIQDIINDLESEKTEVQNEVTSSNVTQNLEIPSPKTSVEQETNSIASKSSISTPEILLYLGSFLITFSMLVLVALGWETIPGTVKSVILIITVLGFAIGGLLLRNHEKLKSVGLTFLTIASIDSPLAFLGIWNFNFSQVSGISFSLYWTIISIIIVLLNLGLLLLTGSKARFFYLLLASVYSLIISLAFTLTDDNNFRIVIIAILNLGFYLSQSLYGSFSKNIILVSRYVNFVLNIGILFTVFTLVSEITVFGQQVLALIAILVPTLFIIISYFRDNSEIETGFEVVLACAKVFLVASIFRLEANSMILLLAVFAIVYILFSEFIFKKRSRILYYLGLIISGLMLLIANSGISVTWRGVDNTVITLATAITVLSLTLFATLFVPLKNRHFGVAGIGLTYLLFILARILGWTEAINDIGNYAYLYLALGLLSGIALINAINFQKENIIKLIQPISELLFIFAAIFGLITFNSTNITVVFLLIGSYYFLRSIITKNDLLRKIAYSTLLVSYPALLNLLTKNGILSLENLSDYGLGLMLPSIIFYVIYEIRKYIKKDYSSELLGALGFSVFSLFLAAESREALWIVLFMVFVFGLIRLIMSLKSTYLVYSYLVLQILIILGLSILESSLVNILLTISVCNLILSSFVLINQSIQNQEIKKLLDLLNSLTQIINIFIIPFTFLVSFTEQNYLYSIILFVNGLNILTSQNNTIKKLSGIAFILGIWNLSAINNVNNIQFYTVPVTIYILILAVISYLQNQKQSGEVLEISAYSFQMLTLLGQSIFGSSDIERIGFGIVLIVMSILLIILGLFRSKKLIWSISLIFLILELIIRLYIVILIIPWWIYLGVIGIALISFASFIIYRSTSNK